MLGSRKVQCWIFSKNPQNTIYCLLLKTNPQRGAYWQPVTGTVEDHEGYFEAACREPIEETGFRFESAPTDTGFEFEFTSRAGVAKEHVFALYVTGMPKPRIDPKEHQDFMWTVPEEALSQLRFPSNVSGLQSAYQKMFGTPLKGSK